MTATFQRWDLNPVIYTGQGFDTDHVSRSSHWPRRSTLTDITNAIVQIRFRHNQAYSYDAGYDGGEFSGPAHQRAEERELALALADAGWTWTTLEEELRRRTTARWAHYIVMGWF